MSPGFAQDKFDEDLGLPTRNIGRHVDYMSTSRKGVKTTRRGVIDGMRRGPGKIVDMVTKQEWPSFQFRIKPVDGGRAFWTTSYPDKTGDMQAEWRHLGGR